MTNAKRRIDEDGEGEEADVAMDLPRSRNLPARAELEACWPRGPRPDANATNSGLCTLRPRTGVGALLISLRLQL